ncbi:MAG: LysR family transcriptional regulator [Alphaproteobacteria bacterium]
MDAVGEMVVFARVVDDGGFSAAARQLNLSPSAVSKQITRLEDRLGVRLLTRTTRRLSVTEEGDAYYHRVKRILADIDEAEQAVSASKAVPRGNLRLTVSNAYGQERLIPILPKFLAQYPEITVEVIMTDAVVDLVEQGVDLAIRQGRLANSAMVARKLCDARRLVVGTPSYFEKFGIPREPADLAKHNCLAFAGNPGLNDWRFVMPDGREQTIRTSGNFLANNGQAVYKMTLAGLGLARLSDFLVTNDVAEGRLVPVLTDYLDEEITPIHVVYPDPRHLSPKVRVLIDFLVANAPCR